MLIRNAVLSDSVDIARLPTALGYAAELAAITGRLTRLVERHDQIVLLAVLGGQVVGWLQAHASEALESGFRVEIVGLIVCENQRRSGVGRCLVARAEQWASDL